MYLNGITFNLMKPKFEVKICTVLLMTASKVNAFNICSENESSVIESIMNILR